MLNLVVHIVTNGFLSGYTKNTNMLAQLRHALAGISMCLHYSSEDRKLL
jgi:hypothetical protein